MSAQPVDVLAVMDRARDVLAEIYAKHQRAIGPFATQAQKSNGSLREARAAVAELVEAASAGGVMRSHGDDKECLWFGPEKAARLRAALARVQGGAA